MRPSATSPIFPIHLIDIIKRSLKGETFVPAAEAFRITRSLPHGHVEAVLKMIRKLGLDDLIASEPSRRRDLVDRHDRRTPALPQLQAGQHPTLARHHLGRGVGRRRRHRGSALRRHGLAAGAAGGDREEARPAAPRRRGAGALRRHQQLLRGEDLPAGPLRPRPRRQDRLPDHRLRRVDRRRRPAGRRAGLSRQHRRPQDRPRPGRGAHEAVRPVARRAGRRSWHAHANSD